MMNQENVKKIHLLIAYHNKAFSIDRWLRSADKADQWTFSNFLIRLISILWRQRSKGKSQSY